MCSISFSFHQDHAVHLQAADAKKLQMRLEKAERAIEQERATIKQLQHALQAAQQVAPSIMPILAHPPGTTQYFST